MHGQSTTALKSVTDKEIGVKRPLRSLIYGDCNVSLLVSLSGQPSLGGSHQLQRRRL
jgi:hypothetical protein